MREIKFRAWHKNEGVFLIKDLYFFEEEGIHDFKGNGISVEYKFMQCTGIKDKESNEIYEDDILQEDTTGKLFRCEWVDKLASFKLVLMEDPQTMFGMSVAGGFTVVGNVHELGAE